MKDLAVLVAIELHVGPQTSTYRYPPYYSNLRGPARQAYALWLVLACAKWRKMEEASRQATMSKQQRLEAQQNAKLRPTPSLLGAVELSSKQQSGHTWQQELGKCLWRKWSLFLYKKLEASWKICQTGLIFSVLLRVAMSQSCFRVACSFMFARIPAFMRAKPRSRTSLT